PDGIYLKNLSKVNPALVNDAESTTPTLLKEGDRIQIGNTIFLYSEEERPEINTSPKAQKKKGGYDDIFGDIEPPEEVIETPIAPPLETPRETVIEPEELRITPAPPKPEMTAYDTIFEDTGIEEEIPFNLIPESPLMLK